MRTNLDLLDVGSTWLPLPEVAGNILTDLLQESNRSRKLNFHLNLSEKGFERRSGRVFGPCIGAKRAERDASGALFEAIRHPKTGEPYTNAEVSRMSAGGLTEGEAQGIRSGAIPDLTVSQVAALASVFGVEPSYLVDRKEPPSLDAKLLEGLGDETTRQITREALRLPERDGGIVLGIVRQFGAQSEGASGEESGRR
jgi:hypothetical protein